MPANWS